MFKAVKGYEGIYEVNELGQVRSIDRMVEHKDGRVRKYKGKELKLAMDRARYAVVYLSKNGVVKTCKVHRLVADAFVSNPDNLPEVHHKNHVRNDNRVCNLQWVTRAEQTDDHRRAATSKASSTRVRVVGHDIDRIYDSALAVQRELGISNSYVSLVANGKYEQAKGYRIYFVDKEIEA